MSTPTPLDGEIAQLHAELAKDLRFIRLKHLERLRNEYLSLPSVASSSSTPPNQEPASADSNAGDVEGRTAGRRRSPEREEALKEARALLVGKTEPTRLSDIDAHLTDKGIRLGGSDPLNNLSALLSTSGIFTAHGRAGWTLTQ